MSNNKTKRIIAKFFIAVQLLIFPFSVLAQATPTCSPNDGSSCAGGYITGFTVNATLQTALVAASTANLACETAEQKYFNAATVKQLSFSGLSMIGGSGAQLAQYSADLVAIDGPPGDITVPPLGFIPCRKFVLGLLDKVVAPNIFISNQKQTLYNSVNAALVNLKAREESVKAKQANATQGFWKTLVFNILIKTSKSVANTLVGKLVNNYKIKDFKQYADSVATLVYDNQFIKQNYPDNKGQMMARAILTNPLMRNQVPTALFIAADGALGFDPKTLSINDPNYYAKMASVGAGQANPYLQHSIYVSNVDAAHASAISYSQNQISQSNGLKTPVNCAGSLAQQKAIDGQTKALGMQLDNREALLTSLNNAKDAGKQVSAGDISKAQADYDAALAVWIKAPNAMPANSAAMVICEAIVAPPILINKGIDQAFNAMGAKMAQYDNNNLPSFINIIGDVASQIGTSFVLGGAQGAKGAVLMNEGRLVNSVVGAAGDYASMNSAANIAKGITNFTFESDPGATNIHTLNWEVNQDIIKDAAYVTITGDGSPTSIDPKTGQKTVQKLNSLTGAVAITSTKSGVYTIIVYDALNKVITSATTNLIIPSGPPATPEQYVCGGQYVNVQACIDDKQYPESYCNAICGTSANSPSTVLGAFTSKPSLSIRGPAVVINPRGE